MLFFNQKCLVIFWMLWIFIFKIPVVALGASDTETLKRLEQMIKQQQAQIEAQAKAIETLKNQVQMLNRQAEQKPTSGQVPAKSEKVVQSSGDKVSLQLYGQVNRAVLYSNDGNDDYFYHVDNDNSSTRIGLLGKSNVSSDITAGTRIEVEFQSNPSNEVDQNNRNGVGDNNFKKRHLDLYFQSKRFGKLSLGYGDTASNNSSEVDLSGTAVIGYSAVQDIAGGQLFYDSGTDSLSTTRISDVMNNMDGLGRDDRLRYDTPNLYGLVASASTISGGGNDIALNYAAQLGSIKLAAAAAYGDPISTSSVENQFNGSVSALHSKGLNVTLAAGSRELKATGRDDATFFYGKLGYKRQFFSTGVSAFAIDYSRFEEIKANDDEADTFGAMFVQDFAKWGTEYYLGYRHHDLDRTGTDFKTIDAVLTGFRVKF